MSTEAVASQFRHVSCVVVACVKCGEEDDGERGTPHFTDVKEARESLLDQDWGELADGSLVCQRCAEIAGCEADGGHTFDAPWRATEGSIYASRFCSNCNFGERRLIADSSEPVEILGLEPLARAATAYFPPADPSFDCAAFFAELDRVRLAAGMSWSDVCARTSVERTTWVRLAQGRKPDTDSLFALCDWSGLNAVSFVRESSSGENLNG